MPKHKTITDAAASRFKDDGLDHFDSSYPGLHLRCSVSGLKTWRYAYRHGGKQGRMTFDPYPAMSVEAAHEAWRKARDQLRTGHNPVIPTAPTHFGGVFEEWLQRDQAKNRSCESVRRSIATHVLPHWQHRPINKIVRRDALDVIDAVADKGTPIAARRLHSYLHRLFVWSVGRGIIELNPLANVDRPAQENKRDRVLSDAELAKVWNAAERMGLPHGRAFQLLILTGARREEVGQLRRSEIVGDAIHLDGARTKNGEPHIIPLSTAARAVIAKMPHIAGSDYVFTFSGARSVSGWAKAKRTLDNLSGVTDWVTHDLRRTCATGLQRLGTPLQVTEAVLNHVSGSRSGIVGIYQRHDYADEKRAALEAWGAHVMALVQ